MVIETGHTSQYWNMTAMNHLDMNITMVFMGITLKYSKNAVQQRKRFKDLYNDAKVKLVKSEKKI